MAVGQLRTLTRTHLEPSEVPAHVLRPHELRRETPDAVEKAPAPDPGSAELIDAYWDQVEERVLFLLPLLAANRHDEALTLCATYLEGVAHALVSANGPASDSFADETEELASDPYLSLVHPLQLVRIVGTTKGISPSAVHGIAARFPGPGHTLLLQEQAVAAVRETLAPTDAAIVERALWKCTIAYVVYDFIRGQSFQRREGARTIGLGAAFHEGETVQVLSVPELVSLLQSMVGEARARSHASGTLPEGT